ncbi:hypothetical protein GCM10027605_24290 [Micromonospora zhanjiangensis]
MEKRTVGQKVSGQTAKVSEADPDDRRRALSRTVGRRLVRTGFTLVMPRWGDWTSDLDGPALTRATRAGTGPWESLRVSRACRPGSALRAA